MPTGQLETVLDNIGRPVTLTYDAQGRLDTITNPEGEVKTYSYTADNLLTGISDQTGRTLKTVMYNDAGQAYEVQNGAGEIMTSVGISTTDSLTRTVIQNGVEMLHTYD